MRSLCSYSTIPYYTTPYYRYTILLYHIPYFVPYWDPYVYVVYWAPRSWRKIQVCHGASGQPKNLLHRCEEIWRGRGTGQFSQAECRGPTAGPIFLRQLHEIAAVSDKRLDFSLESQALVKKTAEGCWSFRLKLLLQPLRLTRVMHGLQSQKQQIQATLAVLNQDPHSASFKRATALRR